jgi:hypothetical protein
MILQDERIQKTERRREKELLGYRYGMGYWTEELFKVIEKLGGFTVKI